MVSLLQGLADPFSAPLPSLPIILSVQGLGFYSETQQTATWSSFLVAVRTGDSLSVPGREGCGEGQDNTLEGKLLVITAASTSVSSFLSIGIC